MRHLSFGRWSLLFLFLAAVSLQASAGQSAKEYWDRAVDPHAKRCEQAVYACEASKLEPKNKLYRDACNEQTAIKKQSDHAHLEQAHLAYESGDASKFDTVNRIASGVCATSGEDYADAQDLLKKIREVNVIAGPPQPPPDPGLKMAAQAEAQFANGKLESAEFVAKQVTDQSAGKGRANEVIAKIARYHSLELEAKQKEKSDPQGAIKAYRDMQTIAANGPTEVESRIASIQAEIAKVSQPSEIKTDLNSKHDPPTPPLDPRELVARLLDSAARSERQNKLQIALHDYTEASKKEPANTVALGGIARVQSAINRDPAAQAITLATAIRDFYSYKYDDAQSELESYLSSPTAKARGVALFYQGATNLYKAVFEGNGRKPQDVALSSSVQSRFKAARDAGYRPVPEFLAPIVKCAWEASATGKSCAI